MPRASRSWCGAAHWREHVAVSDRSDRGDFEHERHDQHANDGGQRRWASRVDHDRMWKAREAGQSEPCRPASLFVFIGAVPQHRLAGSGDRRDEFGFIYTGSRSCRTTVGGLRVGRSSAIHSCSRPTCREFFRPAMCGTNRSSAWRAPSAKARSPSSSHIAIWRRPDGRPSDGKRAMDGSGGGAAAGDAASVIARALAASELLHECSEGELAALRARVVGGGAGPGRAAVRVNRTSRMRCGWWPKANSSSRRPIEWR